MADPEPPDGLDSEPGGGFGINSFLSTAPRAIGSITALIGAITALIIALNKVGVIGSADGAATTHVPSPPPPPPPPPPGLFAQVDRANGNRVYFDGETMYVRAGVPMNPFVVLANQQQPLEELGMSVRAKRVGGATDYGLALICRYVSNSNYYFLSVLSTGRYRIGGYRNKKPLLLARGTNSAITDSTNNITVRCVGDRPTKLTLEVNGVPVATARHANGIEGGNIGLRVGTNESYVTVAFDDFVLRHL